MREMRPNARLIWCAVMILASVAYAALVSSDASIASAIAVGYVALLLTIFVLTNVWKKP